MVSVTRAGAARIATADLVGQEGDVLLFAVQRDAADDLATCLDGELVAATH
jgi:hypothetical protein